MQEFLADTMAIEHAMRRDALLPVDACGIHDPQRAILMRVDREDFDAAVDWILPLLQTFRDRWSGRARIVIEEKVGSELLTMPVTRWLHSSR